MGTRDPGPQARRGPAAEASWGDWAARPLGKLREHHREPAAGPAPGGGHGHSAAVSRAVPGITWHVPWPHPSLVLFSQDLRSLAASESFPETLIHENVG